MHFFSESAAVLASAAAFALLSSPAMAQQGDPMNNINDLCTINFYSDNVQAMVCVRDGTSTTFTTSKTQYLRSSVDHACCPTSDTCLVSNASTPVVGCYDPSTKRVSAFTGGGACNLTGNSCIFGSSHDIIYSTSGVTKYTSVKDGKGVADGAGGGGGGSGKPSSGIVVRGPASYMYFPTIAAALVGAGATML